MHCMWVKWEQKRQKKPLIKRDSLKKLSFFPLFFVITTKKKAVTGTHRANKKSFWNKHRTMKSDIEYFLQRYVESERKHIKILWRKVLNKVSIKRLRVKKRWKPLSKTDKKVISRKKLMKRKDPEKKKKKGKRSQKYNIIGFLYILRLILIYAAQTYNIIEHRTCVFHKD